MNVKVFKLLSKVNKQGFQFNMKHVSVNID